MIAAVSTGSYFILLFKGGGTFNMIPRVMTEGVKSEAGTIVTEDLTDVKGQDCTGSIKERLTEDAMKPLASVVACREGAVG